MTNEENSEQLKRLCGRFEIAVGNFGRSCGHLLANEKAFQAWYSAFVIQEFGIARVYREIHLMKDHLFEEFDREHELTSGGLSSGNEVMPDLSVSWEPDVDARHSVTREESVFEAKDLLREFAIVSELKVTGSTKTVTPISAIRRDLAKLMLIQHASPLNPEQREDSGKNGLACYMVILDNARRAQKTDSKRPEYKHTYGKRLVELLEEVEEWNWPKGVRMPTIILLEPNEKGASVQIFRNLKISG